MYSSPDVAQVIGGIPSNFVWRGFKNSVEDRENGDLGVVAPSQGF